MAHKPYKTPGVKPIEKRVFGRVVSTKVTAVPMFIGYTRMNPNVTTSSAKTEIENSEKEGDGNSSKGTPTPVVPLSAVRINSFAEYTNLFGGGDYSKDEKARMVKKFYLFECIKLFFINGGKTCYVVSVGTYKDKEVAVAKLEEGLEKLFEVPQANLVVVPDAVSLGDQVRGKFYNEVLKSCSFKNEHGVFINQFAVLDTKKELKKHEAEASLNYLENDEHLVHGAMYYPWLKTDVVSRTDVEQSLIEGDAKFLEKALGLKAEDKKALGDLSPAGKAGYLRRAKRKEWDKIIDETIENNSLLPPSAAVAGAYVRSDEQYGIQKAPANLVLRGVLGLNAIINDTNQGDFNAPENGKSINCIRSFVNNDIKIWGARTLDCNDLDYRYVNVRRTMSMLQDSIKNLLEKFVFEDNTERTWLKIRASLSKFLKGMLRRGVLAGTTPSAAYEFSVGFGETMDESDINEGIIRVIVKLALIRPAEFIEIIFEQKSMEGAATVEADAAAQE